MSESRAEQIVSVLRMYRIPLYPEVECQNAVGSILKEHSINFEKEFKLSVKSRIDFLCEGGVGIEIKVGGRTSDVFRQLKRYEAEPQIQELILITRKVVRVTGAMFTKKFVNFWLSERHL